MTRGTTLLLTIGLLAATTAPAVGAVTFEGTSGNLSASAEFEIVGDNLQVVLTNTSMADVLSRNDVLTAVFFDIADDPTLTRESAILNTGSTVVHVPGGGSGTDTGGVVGGEWAYRADKGISSSRLGIFGTSDLFPGNNLQGPVNPDGLQYGITSPGDDLTTGRSAVTGGKSWNPISLIQHSVVFTLGNLPLGLSLDDIMNVRFNYGTKINTIPGNGTPPGGIVPEPASLAVWGMLAGVGLIAGFRRRKKQKTAA